MQDISIWPKVQSVKTLKVVVNWVDKANYVNHASYLITVVCTVDN